MEYLRFLIDFIIHIDVHLDAIVLSFGVWSYVILFAIVFAETGLVIAPLLPGDSLLFAAGAIAARGGLDIWILIGVLLLAAIVGDTVNYWIGRLIGERILTRFPRIIQPVYLARTNSFFEKYGGKTIVFARFVPFVRTIAPFVAGAGAMTYRRFMYFNILGAVLWVCIFLPAGYFFANVSFVKENFSLVIFGIIGVSLLPTIVGQVRYLYKKRENSLEKTSVDNQNK